MNSDFHISVITVCRNAAKTIEATLQSVAMQENAARVVEHIVVDGDSDDNTLKVAKQFPAICWISEPENGNSDTFNRGLHLADGKYVLSHC